MFEIGKLYRRRDLHEEFGGQRQGGIVTPRDTPLVLLITGEGGSAYGYDDEQLPDGTFRYFGEGQLGDMEFVRGNRAVRDHASDGRDLHLFRKVRPAHLRYLGPVVCAGYDYVHGVPDHKGTPRTAMVFQLAPAEMDAADAVLSEADIADLDLDALRIQALEPASSGEPATEAKRRIYRRSAEAAGLGHKRTDPKPITFHCLRHTFGTLTVKAWDLRNVQGYMGHSDITTTMGYVHHVPKTADADALSRLIDEAIAGVPDSTDIAA